MKPEDQNLINDEEQRFSNAYQRIREALSQKAKELDDDEALARDLTAQMVAQTQDEEKQALASDEKVAHGLAKLRMDQSRALSDLIKQPYFARVVYNENGRDIEFKLGLGSFPEERIIDWRKGPISKLYYSYEEGEEYDDEIAGVERFGTIQLKRSYRGQYAELSQIEHKDWFFVKHKGQWQKNKKFSNEPFSLEDKQKIKELLEQQQHLDAEQLSGQTGYLSQILALLTPEQFELISKDVEHPVVIQGSAGTGKTTVAMHRLAWLLFEGNANLSAQNTLVVLFHKPLVEYVKNILPSLGIDDVKITTYMDWARDLIQTSTKSKIRFARKPAPGALQDFKASLTCLESLKTFTQTTNEKNPFHILSAYFRSVIQAKTLGEVNTNKLSYEHLQWQSEHDVFDIFDMSLLLHIFDFKNLPIQSSKYPTRLDHLVLDEAQDFTLPEILAITSFVGEKHQLTLAGDLGQKIMDNRHFGSWQDLLAKIGFEDSEVLNLNVAFRSTYQIYKLAEYVRDPNLQEENLTMIPKFGPEPKFTKAHNFEEASFLVKVWIQDQLNINQSLRGAILCRDEVTAKKLFHYLTREKTVGIRYSDARDFQFTPGITITALKNVKGLEFHSICLFDPSEKNFSPFSASDRNLLYMGITRALYRMDLIGHHPLTPMIPSEIQQEDLTDVPPETPDGHTPLFDDPEALSRSES